MFARKGKSSDVMASVQRFTDMNRDSVSRVKHLKILLDSLTIHEKRQLIDDHSFETFHLVDELLLATDIASNSQGAIEAESGLWTLEQVLCLAPELVGNGWQRHAIESLLKKAIYPRNLLAVRKIAIRLYLIFYQSLSVFGKVTPDLDRVFQCLLPYFPLKNGDSTEFILQEYCQSAGTVQWTEMGRNSLASPARGSGTTPNAKERAQMLQVYLDKFLEYCTRESTRIEWNDESRRLQCAKFIIDRVIQLYIMECFPDLETNGVDIFGGWEGAGDTGEPLDTADPVVIARYWLIRWMNNVAGARQLSAGSVHAGMLLFHDALFSSQKATNTALTLMREAMVLPLPCSNVIHKVVSVLSSWLLQYEVPPFVVSGEVSVDSSSLLLINILMSFFHSPYLLQPGDRVNSAVAISFSILLACRDLVSPRTELPHSISVRVWSELMVRLCEAASRVCTHSDTYSQEAAGAFANTVLSNMVVLKAVRQIDIDDKLWDDVHNVFQNGIWIQMAQEWGKIVRSVTRALILHLAHVDIFSKEELERHVTTVSSSKQRERGETNSVEESSLDGGENGEDNVFHDTDDITVSVNTWSGNSAIWLQVWRRVICLLGPHSNANAIIAVDVISQTIQDLLSANLDSLAHWLAARLVYAPIHVLPHCVTSLSAVLNCHRPAPKLLQAHILHAFQKLIQANDQRVFPHFALMSSAHLSVLSPHLLKSVARMSPAKTPAHSHVLLAYALMCTEHKEAQDLLLQQLISGDLSLHHTLLCLNALSLLILQRADHDLLAKVLSVLQQHRYGPRLLPVLCCCLIPLAHFGHAGTILRGLLRALSLLREERTRTEIEWLMTSLCLDCPQNELPAVLKDVLTDKHKLLEGALVSMSAQFPLPSFNVTKWNSVESTDTRTQANAARTAFVHRKTAILSINKDTASEVTSRTVLARHCWILEPHFAERKEGKNVNMWLRKEAMRGRRTGREAAGILGAMGDPFDALPHSNNNQITGVDVSSWTQLVENSRRQPQPLKACAAVPATSPHKSLLEWRSFSASLGFLPCVAEVPPNFSRDLKHLDQTSAREVHKVAVIYVAEGQEDKSSILSNVSASPGFDRFVEQLGWEVKIGHGHDGYQGGLPLESTAPYYATPDSEMLFHVSTKLGGDVTQKWKHIGNDEVHVVWSENYRPYRRETIATKFCDVLIVLAKAGEKTFRVRVETTSSLQFGPLFDGALVGEAELAEMVRLTALNASRAYRLAREDHDRPLRHREHVFSHDTKRHMKRVALGPAINTLYLPSMLPGC